MLMRLLIAAAALWPERWAYAFGALLGHLAFTLGIRRRVALSNLSQAFPDRSDADRTALCRAHYAHLGRSAVEFFRSARWTDAELFARIDAPDWPLFEKAWSAKRGCIVAVAHLGNFELLATYGARRGYPLTAVTRQLSGPINQAWMALRGHLGVRELRGRNVARRMVEVLRAQGVLAVIVDQNMLPKRAVFAPFFGKLAATTPAPHVLAERTGAPILLAALLRRPDGRFGLRLLGPFAPASDAEATMAQLNAALETLIREAPEQWFWVHRRWKTRPVGEPAP
jgi:KDO2-lipid IV(A) lauroyltransferase